MGAAQPIRGLFASDIGRNIEEVVKVDQRDEAIIRDEIDEYVVTDAILKRYLTVLDKYADAPNHPSDGIGVWVSGFFGSGKSSFAKLLGYAVQNKPILGVPAGERLAEHVGNAGLTVLLGKVAERMPTHAVIFDVATDRGIRSGNQTLTEITYRLFLESLGYARDLDLAELEIGLEAEGKLAAFEDAYRSAYERDWSEGKTRTAFALLEASRVMHDLDPQTNPQPETWAIVNRGKADVSAGLLGRRAKELMERRKPGHALLVVIDEVGQFVARDVQKMLDLQAIVQNFGMISHGRHWLVVTSQERLGELVSGLDDQRVEYERLLDRFPRELQVHLESTDISEVTSKRVLKKNAEGQATLGAIFEASRTRLTENVAVSADIKLPELTRESFMDLYPLLPYQVDLIIGVVSGLRSHGGVSPHVGGAARTIIKLAQQLLVSEEAGIADQPVGALVTLDRVYDLVAGGLPSEVRGKIAEIPSRLPGAHPLAQRVAKAICMLQQAPTFKRTAENVAACLHPSVDADSQLASVREALAQLESAHYVRSGEDGYRISTPAEDDFETRRNGFIPKPADANRIYQEVLASLWQPQPSYMLEAVKPFKGGLTVKGKVVTEGDITFYVELSEEASAFDALASELRARSRTEQNDVFWAVSLTGEVDDLVIELFRSRSVIAAKERDARTQIETNLVTEEKRRRDAYEARLRKALAAACVAGSAFFRGNERGIPEGSIDLGKAASSILADVTPEIFDRFHEAAAKGPDAKKGTDALLVAENLKGLPPVFASLGLLRTDKGNTALDWEHGPLAEVLGRIKQLAAYGQTATGKYLEAEFAKQPFGWDFEVVRLLVLCLLRAGRIEGTSKGVTFDSATSSEAQDAFNNNPAFRVASFRPAADFAPEQLIIAAQAFKDTFGGEVRELALGPIAAQLRGEVSKASERVSGALIKLTVNRLPGAQALEAGLGPMKAIGSGSDASAVTGFNAAHQSIKDAVKRAAELDDALTEPRIADIERALKALAVRWPALQADGVDDPDFAATAETLRDLLERETFFRELPAIDQAAAKIEKRHAEQIEAARAARAEAYGAAVAELKGTPGWTDLTEAAQAQIAGPLEALAAASAPAVALSQVRSDTEVCPIRLQQAQKAVAVATATDTEQVVVVYLRPFFAGGIETQEQLDAALAGVRDKLESLIGAGKKIVLG
jgi:hypothetical protein